MAPVSALALAEPFAWVSSEDAWLIRWRLGGFSGAFSTRVGGVSEGDFSSLNLGFDLGDSDGNVEQNRARLVSSCRVAGDGPTSVVQQHGTEIVTARKARARCCQADGVLVSHEGESALIAVADCLPVALVGGSAAVVAHVGWRGLSAGILEQSVALLQRAHGSRPSQLGAVIGPGIGPCCYEVGADLARRFVDLGLGDALGEDRKLDLVTGARVALTRAGVGGDSIYVSAICTACHEDLFFSHRRSGGRTGRQGGLVWISN